MISSYQDFEMWALHLKINASLQSLEANQINGKVQDVSPPSLTVFPEDKHFDLNFV